VASRYHYAVRLWSVCFQFEFNSMSMYTKSDSERWQTDNLGYFIIQSLYQIIMITMYIALSL